MESKIKILSGIDPRQFFPNQKHIILYAFSIGDRHYFRFDDPLAIPYDRGLKTLVYYRELDMNVDRDTLVAHTQAFDNVLSGQKVTLKEILDLKQLNDQLKAKLQLPKEPELMYKLASVVFFDQHENPNTYEFKYGEAKIRHWKKEASLSDFFLQMPLRQLIPYLDYAGENIEQFSQMTQKAKNQHLAFLSSMLSEKQKTALKSKSQLSPAQ